MIKSTEVIKDMKRILAILLLTIFIGPHLFALEQKADPFPLNRGSIYEYGDDIPDVCFFPVNKARWDGYKVTTKTWNQLTDFQKVMFLSEGISEIEIKNQVKVDDSIKGSPLFLISINTVVDDINKSTTDNHMTMLEFIFNVLKYDKRIMDAF